MVMIVPDDEKKPFGVISITRVTAPHWLMAGDNGRAGSMIDGDQGGPGISGPRSAARLAGA
jgi:hypothetical protein